MRGSPARGAKQPHQPVVAHIDMDCFYVAVERMHDKSLHGVPCAVMQYNPYEENGVKTVAKEEDRRQPKSNGSIIAVSYEARAKGVTRQMRGNEAKRKCPDLVLVQVPTAFGKADLQIYKSAGDQVGEMFLWQYSDESNLRW